MSSSKVFFVTGGTGRIGTAFVHEMASRGHTVRLGTRNPAKAESVLRANFGPGIVEPVVMSIDDQSGLEKALEGCTGGLLVAPFGEMKTWHQKMTEAAVAQNVSHLVKVSVTGARGPDNDPPPGRIPSMHWEGEEIVRASGIPSTVIRPTIFAQHFFGLSQILFSKGSDKFYLPTGDTKVAWLDCRDIAICAAAILSSEEKCSDFAGAAFELTGPTAVSAAEIATILGAVSGRDIQHVDGMDAFTKRAQELELPDMVKGIYQEAAEGWFSKVENQEFFQLTGRYTTSFAKYAFDHASWFAAK